LALLFEIESNLPYDHLKGAITWEISAREYVLAESLKTNFAASCDCKMFGLHVKRLLSVSLPFYMKTLEKKAFKVGAKFHMPHVC